MIQLNRQSANKELITVDIKEFELSTELISRIQTCCNGEGAFFISSEITYLQEVVNKLKDLKIDPSYVNSLQEVVNSLFCSNICLFNHLNEFCFDEVLKFLPLSSIHSLVLVKKDMFKIMKQKLLKIKIEIESVVPTIFQQPYFRKPSEDPIFKNENELIEMIILYNKRITHLNLPEIISMDLLTTSSLNAIAVHCCRLSHLNMKNCQALTGKELLAISGNLPIVELNFKGCYIDTDSMLQFIKENWQQNPFKIKQLSCNGGPSRNINPYGDNPFWRQPVLSPSVSYV